MRWSSSRLFRLTSLSLDGIQVERDVDHGAQHLVFLAQEITHMGLRLFGCDHHHSARAINPRGTTTWNLGNQLLNRLEQGLAYIHAALLHVMDVVL